MLDRDEIESFDSWSFTRSEKGGYQVDIRGWHVAGSLPRLPDEASLALFAWHLMPDADALPPSCSNLLVGSGSHQ